MNFTLNFGIDNAWTPPTTGSIYVDISRFSSVKLTRMMCSFFVTDAVDPGIQFVCDGRVLLSRQQVGGSNPLLVGNVANVVVASSNVRIDYNLGEPLCTSRVPFEGDMVLPTSDLLVFVFYFQYPPGLTPDPAVGAGGIISYSLEYVDSSSNSKENNLEVLDPVVVERMGKNLQFAKHYHSGR